MMFSSQNSNKITDSTFAQATKQWTESMIFNQNETVGFSFRPDNDWSIAIYGLDSANVSGTYIPVKYLQANITGPESNCTMVRIYVLISQLNGGVSYMSVYEDYFDVYNKTSAEPWVRANRTSGFQDPDGSLVIEKGYPKTENLDGENVFQLGKTSLQGNYTLTCSLDPEYVEDVFAENNSRWFHPVSPPPILRLYKSTTRTEYPNFILLPIGAGTSVLGVIVVVWGIRSGKKMHPLRARKGVDEKITNAFQPETRKQH